MISTACPLPPILSRSPTVLRGEWKFDGFVVSDYTSVEELIKHGVAANGADAAREALNAGVDMEMVSRLYNKHAGELISERQAFSRRQSMKRCGASCASSFVWASSISRMSMKSREAGCDLQQCQRRRRRGRLPRVRSCC